MQAAYSGSVTRYYGEEIGDEVPSFDQKVGGDCASLGLCDDHVARSSAKIPGVTVTEGQLAVQQKELLQFHRELMAVRDRYAALSRGDRQHLYSDDGLYVDLKAHGSQKVVFAMNAGNEAREVRISMSLLESSAATAWNILDGAELEVSEGYLVLNLEPLSGVYAYPADQPLQALAINPGLNDAWYNPETNGQGLLVTVFPDNELMFLAWFTFDAERPPPSTPSNLGEAGHRWFTAQGRISGNRALLDVYTTSGGVFDAPNPPAETEPSGWIELEFESCLAARMRYRVEPAGLEGEIDLQRVVPDNAALCETLNQP